MKVNVRYIPRTRTITIKRLGYLESQVSNFISNLHFSQDIDRVLLSHGQVVWIGGKQYTGYPGQPADEISMSEERDNLRQALVGF